MAFSSSHPALQKQLTIFRTGTTRGFKLLALTVNDPNAGGITPTDCTIAMAPDSSFWKSNGAIWSLVSSTSGGDIYPDDVFVTFGDGSAADGGNVVVGLDDNGGKRTFIIHGDAYSGAALVGTTAPISITTGSATVTGAGTGPLSGDIDIISGLTNSTNAGGTGGDTGSVTVMSGNALSTLGTSGVSGDATFGSGNSVDDQSGAVSLTSGNAATGSGTVTVASGNTGAGASGLAMISTGAASGTGSSGPAGVFTGNATGTGGSGDIGLRTGAAAAGDSGNIDIITGDAGGTAGDIVVAPGDGATQGGSVEVRIGTAAATSGSLAIDAAITTPAANLTSTSITVAPGDVAATGVPLQTKQIAITAAGAQTIPVHASIYGAGDATLLDLVFIKTGAGGLAGDTVTIATSLGTWCVIDLTAVAAGTVIRLGAAAAPVTAANRLAARGTNITVTTAEASSADGLLTLMLAN